MVDDDKSMEDLINEVMEEYKGWVLVLMVCPYKCKNQPPWVCLAKPLPDGSYEFEGEDDRCDECNTIGVILSKGGDGD